MLFASYEYVDLEPAIKWPLNARQVRILCARKMLSGVRGHIRFSEPVLASLGGKPHRPIPDRSFVGESSGLLAGI